MSHNYTKCPFCGSNDIHLSLDTQIKRGLGHVAEFGIGFAAGYLGLGELVDDSDINIADTVDKEWECNSCGRTWNSNNTPALKQSYSNNDRYSSSKKQPLTYKQKKSPDLVEREKQYKKGYINCLKSSQNGRISSTNREMLDELRDRLRLTGTCAVEIESAAINEYRANRLSKQTPGNNNEAKKANGVNSITTMQLQTSNNGNNEQGYIDALKDCLSDGGDIQERERRLLERIRIKCCISSERANELENLLKKPQLTDEEKEYLEAYREACEDSQLSDKERHMLNRLRDMLGITEERAKEIEK